MGWGTDGGAEAARRARAGAHARRHRHPCPCGRELWGNGWRSHARRCADYLEQHGWEWNGGDRTALFNSLYEMYETYSELDSDQRSAKVREAMRAASIQEAKDRGLLDADGRAVSRTAQ
ncbi:hypothetical protein I0C86_41160 [Plantactinospora sp. S1510]|uniref:Uncharacterized protein n=1 Tax=Plantactinospora alkalitolerans TaxID=2789879 RepID=A0ABS0H9V1_9ACTN|nr:hypothetical protein [Plantactinospora alkalitolerans]MBF9135262.1 hypothetical protein [Plantactinospora alkalitolerans]